MQFRAGIKTKWSCLQEEREEGETAVGIAEELIN